MDELIEKTIASLKKNSFDAYFACNGNQAIELILGMIPQGATVGSGYSTTAYQLKLLDKIKKRGNTVTDPFADSKSDEEKYNLQRKVLTSDVFITGTNAITMDGKIVNVDGTGNRVSAMFFGPKKSIIIVGKNKIVKDVNAALARIKNIAAPMNCKRLGKKTPCVVTGTCTDCDSPDRICRITTILEKKSKAIEASVVIIGQDYGF